MYAHHHHFVVGMTLRLVNIRHRRAPWSGWRGEQDATRSASWPVREACVMVRVVACLHLSAP